MFPNVFVVQEVVGVGHGVQGHDPRQGARVVVPELVSDHHPVRADLAVPGVRAHLVVVLGGDKGHPKRPE